MSANLPSATDGMYNTLCDALKLSNKQFQMIQGVLPVQSNASGLYNFLDGIPPESVAVLYTSNPVNSLNGNVQIMLNDAVPGFLTTLATNNYMNSAYWVNGNVAVDPIYAPSFADLQNQVNAGSSATFSFDSETSDTNISDSWADSSSSAGVGFWGTSSSSVSTELNSMASSSRITVEGNFNKFAYLNTRPGGWFTQGFFTNQYQKPSDWKEGQTDWDKVFGPNGSAQRIANQILLVDGYTITVRSYASYSESQYSEVQKSSETNVWPFYTSSSHSTAVQSHHYNDDKSITTTITQAPGSLQIFGVGVLPTSEAIQGDSVSRMI
ncbi:hypothetical protein [Thalassococcus lentus]|uniref:Uncharacterized protein n=1 Tax=Thalassococcus lentus TaxID=1210524 RepID=A0ABT4XUK1_9RHOB|nr:hypothetical protein [Thalassococcus lentus]MDA7425636.1 hypothetical protein [Thalassococcus lentus]